MGQISQELAVELLLNSLKNENIRSVKNILNSNYIIMNEWLDDLGVTALHLAVGSGSEAFAAYISHEMLKCGADPNQTSLDGMTPVHVAAAWGRTTVLHLLLLHGGDPWRLDHDCRNAFSYAFEAKAWSLLDLLHNFQTRNQLSDPRCCTNNDLQSEASLSDQCNENYDDDSVYSENQSSRDSESDYGNVHNVTFSIECKDITADESKVLPNNVFVSTCTHSLKNKEIYINQNHENNISIESTNAKDKECCLSSPETSPKKMVMCKKVVEKSPLANEKRLTYTIVSPKKSAVSEVSNRNIHADLFTELLSAVRRRSLRISGIETLPSESLVCLDTSNVSDCLNKAVISESVLENLSVKDNSSSEKQESGLCALLTAGSQILQELRPDVQEGRDQDDQLDGDVKLVPISKADLSFYSLSETDTSTSSSNYSSCQENDQKTNSYDDADEIRKKLILYGLNPGPITATTKAVYERLLSRMECRGLPTPTAPVCPPNTPANPVTSPAAATYSHCNKYSAELENVLLTPSQIESYSSYEEKLRRAFDGVGRSRTCFNYLLLDGRVTMNLPHRVRTGKCSADEAFVQFISAVFYVGKGQASRPLEHLREAKLYWQHNGEGRSPKEAKILDIWRDGHGVVCLRVMQDISQEEALTREAAIIEALRRQNICNLQPGHFHGQTSQWSAQEKKKLGVYLLFVAKGIFLQTQERSFRPTDL